MIQDTRELSFGRAINTVAICMDEISDAVAIKVGDNVVTLENDVIGVADVDDITKLQTVAVDVDDIEPGADEQVANMVYDAFKLTVASRSISS